MRSRRQAHSCAHSSDSRSTVSWSAWATLSLAPSRALELLSRPAVVVAYVRHLHRDDEDRRWDQWAWNIVNELVEDAAASWPILLDLVAAADDDEVLGVVAAGHLEDWVRAHAVRHINQIELQAARDTRFRDALQGIWVWSSLSDETFERVAAAAGSRLDAPATVEDAAERVARNARHDELWAIVNDESGDEQTHADALKTIEDDP